MIQQPLFSKQPKPNKLALALMLALGGGALVASPFSAVYAEPAAQTPVGEAQVSIYALQSGLPMSGVQVFHGDKLMGRTSTDGLFSVRLPAGQQSLTLKSKDNSLTTLKLNVVKDDQIELIVPINKQAKVINVMAESIKLKNPLMTDGESDTQAEEPGLVAGDNLIYSIIRGTIYSLETGMGVADANIYLTGVSQQIKTNAEGYFEAKVPIGDYSLSVVHPDYSTTTVKGLTLNENEIIEQELDLTPAATELEEFIVTAPALEGGMLALMEEKQNSSGVAEVLSSEEFSRSGDSSAAGALSRVTGLTLVGGKYIYVRGMGDRYSATRLNGAGLPSPEPSKRVVPLDMFPTGMIGSIVVQKSYSPDLPGEFGGGTVLMRTKPIPLTKNRKISISTGGNSNSTFQEGLDYEGGSTDFLGIDDGGRALDGFAESFIKNPPSSEDQANQDLYKIAQSLPNKYEVKPATLNPDMGFSMDLGDRYESYDGNSGWGYNFAMNFSNKSRYTEEIREDVATPSPTLTPELERNYKTKYSTNLGLMGTLIYEIGEDHKFDATTIIARSTSDTVALDTSYSFDNENNFKNYSLQWEERQLLSQQFHGTHILSDRTDTELEWQTTISQASRLSPDTRIYTYQQNAAHPVGETYPYEFQYRGDGNQRMWEELTDLATSTTLDLNQPLYDFFGMTGKFKTGLLLETKDRTSDTYKFSWDTQFARQNYSDELQTGNPEDIFQPENIGTDFQDIRLKSITNATDSYKAQQNISALYAMIDLNVLPYLNTMIGGRYESSKQTVEVFTDNQRTESEENTLEKSHFLPALNFTIPYKDGEQVRLSYSQTINRPDLKELSRSTYIDPDTREYYSGNPELQIAEIQNIDLRWEKYLNSFENFSLAVFSKQFKNPIEVTEIPAIGGTYYTYDNVDAAINQGLEFQGRFWLRRLFGNSIPAFYIDTNLTVIDSKIDLSNLENSILTNTERPLQGQAPWVVNLNIGYENLIKEINANLLLNMQGDSISKVGTKGSSLDETGVQDTYLVTPPTLNFVYSQRLYWGAEDKLKLKVKIDNILNGKYQERVLDNITKTYQKGISASASLTYTWK